MQKQALIRVIEKLDQLGCGLSSDWIRRAVSKNKNAETSKPKNNPSEIFRENLSALTKADACIFEVSYASWGIAYQAAYSISKEMPTLCLYDESNKENYLSPMLLGIKSKQLDLKPYTVNNLEEVVENFVHKVESSQLVKFNFIANKQIKKYVDWKSKLMHISKSAFLREAIQKYIIDADDDYRNTIL